MLYLSENLKKYRVLKNLTQEDVAAYLGITAQSVSKWERNESYPDITFLPALANIFETSIDLLIGMDTIRAEETTFHIHKKAVTYQQDGDYDMAEKTYRDALRIYPNKPEMIFGLATMRAALYFLYVRAGKEEKANKLASELPHARECREVIQPLIRQELNDTQIEENIKNILLGADIFLGADILLGAENACAK